MTVDSSGNIYFRYNLGCFSNNSLVQLNPVTNVFTQYNNTGGCSIRMIIDSSNKIFFDTNTNGIGQAIRKLDPSTNTETIWQLPVAINGWNMDSSGNIYYTGGDGKIGKFNTNTNTLTTWSGSVAISYITSDSSGNIFFTEPPGPRGKLARITLSDNTLTEWIIPNSGLYDTTDIVTDSLGNVFFTNQNNLVRFVPSTEVFTFFPSGCITLKIASDNTLYCSGSSGFSKIT